MPVEDQLKYYDEWGGPMTTPHMSVAWSWAFDTPFQMDKANRISLRRNKTGNGNVTAKQN
ncbi:MAG: hypothetical protein R3A12_18935 [Ignavibacteria bacterium]